MRAPCFAEIVAARRHLDGVARRTPVLTSMTADQRLDARLFFKAENFQHTGSFKFRGAVNAIAHLGATQRAGGVIAFSSGNHAQAVARAAALAGVACWVVMPGDVPAAKREAAIAYGAIIVGYDRVSEDREAIAAGIAAKHGLTLIPPFDDAAIIAGQATAAAELFEDVPDLDVLLVCVGGGGLIAGSVLAAATMAPACIVIGVEPEAGDDVRQSMRAGTRVRIDVPVSIADGALTTQVGQLNFDILQHYATEIVSVADAALIAAMRFFAERMKIVVEPTGCLAAAAAFSGAVAVAGKRVGVVVSGGNVDLAALCRLIG